MVPAARRNRLVLFGKAIAALLAAVVLAAGCGSPPRPPAAIATKPPAPARSTARTPDSTPSATAARSVPVPVGAAGRYHVGERQIVFTEPAHVGVTGQHLGQRSLLAVIRYPVRQGSSRAWPAGGPFPLIMFAPGFQQCSSTYEHLLQTWASAGYVVASVDFPRTSCLVGSAAYEPDLVNQPGDVTYVLSRLLALNAQAGGFLSDRLNPHEIAAAGQSDGGDTVAALAANTCCQDHRVEAVAVLSGAEWPPMPGPYFAGHAPPMLFVQGNADTINPPWTSLQLYRADRSRLRYYLNLLGADHMVPYTGDNPVERLVARVTLAFFGRYLLGDAGAVTTMKQTVLASGIGALGSGGQVPSDTG